jgi:hypothetical protein
MTLSTTDLAALVARYAGRFHAAAGPDHHVGSPLGAWLLLALCGPASTGPARSQLAEALGCDVDAAAVAAAALLAAPHPLVATAAAAWWQPGVTSAALLGWLAGLPGQAETGELTSQAALDDWARRSTAGMISKFPIRLTPDTLILLATVLAAKVSWEQPFDVAAAGALGPGSPWASQVSRVLRTPPGRQHRQFIAATDRAGDVAVHTAHARGGLLVTSVAAHPGVPPADVLAVAYPLASAIAVGGDVVRRSLFDLPAGPAPLWDIKEQHVQTTARDGREEHCTAVLPAWSVASMHNLAQDDSLGFLAAGAALAALTGPGPAGFDARQAAVARYSRVGFEAAAVTALAVMLSLPASRPGLLRTAQLRFGHPFAAVAVTANDPGSTDVPSAGAWHGLPVFSAWITQPEDADEPA